MQEYPSKDASSLEEMVACFLSNREAHVSYACFGIAGPVFRGRCKVTNLSWSASEHAIRDHFQWRDVRLINDLVATGLAIPLLHDSECLVLREGEEDPQGTIGLIAPGTGLGVTLFLAHQHGLLPIPSEGGHVDFAPANEEEIDLWRYLRAQGGHISAERVLSGPGLLTIYRWLKDSGRHKEPPWLRERLQSTIPQKAITESAIRYQEPLCAETLDRFVSLLGSFAGNLALTGITTGGIFLGGGMCPQIVPKLEQGIFLEAFLNKGRFRDLLARMPVRVILNDHAALLGAARCACDAYAEEP